MGNKNGNSNRLTKAPQLSRGISENLMGRKEIRAFEDEYEMIEELGSGVTGTVWLIKRKAGGGEFAMKTFNLNRIDSHQIIELRSEVELMKTFDHPNIVRLVETFEDKKSFKLILDLCKGGNVLQGQKRLHTERDVATVIFQVLLALCYLHDRNVVHRDIKLENIMFSSEDPENKQIQLIDFGLSTKHRTALRFFENKRLLATACGTTLYMAPEVFQRAYDKQCDSWSVGILTFILLTGKPPFYDQSEKVTIDKILKGYVDFTNPLWHKFSPEAKVLVENLLLVDPTKRWTAKRAIESPWFGFAKQDAIKKSISNSAMTQAPIDQELAKTLKRFVSYGELKKIALLVIAHRAAGDELSQLRAVFSEMDHDNSATITCSELTKYLQTKGVSAEEAQKLFEAIDIDKSGEIQLVEFLAASCEAAFSVSKERMVEAFDHISQGGNFITAKNLKNLMGDTYSNARARKILGDVDTNGDGRISREEFLSLVEESWQEEIEQLAENVAHE